MKMSDKTDRCIMTKLSRGQDSVKKGSKVVDNQQPRIGLRRGFQMRAIG